VLLAAAVRDVAYVALCATGARLRLVLLPRRTTVTLAWAILLPTHCADYASLRAAAFALWRAFLPSCAHVCLCFPVFCLPFAYARDMGQVSCLQPPPFICHYSSLPAACARLTSHPSRCLPLFYTSFYGCPLLKDASSHNAPDHRTAGRLERANGGGGIRHGRRFAALILLGGVGVRKDL